MVEVGGHVVYEGGGGEGVEFEGGGAGVDDGGHGGSCVVTEPPKRSFLGIWGFYRNVRFSVNDLVDDSVADAERVGKAVETFSLGESFTDLLSLIVVKASVVFQSAFSHCVVGVVLVCSEEQVGRSDARWVVAVMTNSQAVRDWSSDHVKSEAAGDAILVISVPGRESFPRPFPTAFSDSDVSPEPGRVDFRQILLRHGEIGVVSVGVTGHLL